MISTMITSVTTAKVTFCRLRSGASHRPSVRNEERSIHGHSVSTARRNPGSSIPPSNAPLTVNPPMRTVVEATNSWSQTKYHGAFAGFGVTDGLARPSSGALNSNAASQRDVEHDQEDQRDSPRHIRRRENLIGLFESGRTHHLHGGARRNSEQRITFRLWNRLRHHRALIANALDRRETAVLAHAPHVIAEQHQREERQEENVQHVKAQQGLLPNFMATKKKKLNRRSGHRCLLRDTGPNRDCPECELIPRQQVTGEGQEQSREKKNDPDHPVDRPGAAVRASEEHPRHVDVHDGDHSFRRPSMLISEQAAEADGVLEVLDAPVCALGGR